MSPDPERCCLRCGGAAGYNRVVVDLVADTVVGSLCRNCELDHLSDRIEPADRRSPSECDCDGCNRDPLFSFPRWLPETTVSNGHVHSTVTIDPTERTLALCDEHLDTFVSGDPFEIVGSRAASEFR